MPRILLWIVAFPLVAGEAFVALIVRRLLRMRFGFPPRYFEEAYVVPRDADWVSLGTSRVGGVVTNALKSAVLPAGLGFVVRTTFGFDLMPPVFVPWSDLYVSERSGYWSGRSLLLEVVDVDGKTLNTIEPGDAARSWRIAVEAHRAGSKRVPEDATSGPAPQGTS